ncbi:SixA phosphatase family protein [Streptomyces sp. NPDC002187]|uniref:SixA phosphatase family protein n=1 Tax=Streptomyces sp. NPDC002187 TaxID=3364637 RepID=UPI0036B83DF3
MEVGRVTVVRRLIVVRHAKSAWPAEVDDHDRPLAKRGRRDAPAAGRWLRGCGHVPDLVLCSTAVRARRTWELAAAALDAPPPVVHDMNLYHAGARELLDTLRRTAPGTETVLLVGHNPAVQELVLSVARTAADDALARAREKFPTCAIAVLEWQGSWAFLGPGVARLTAFEVARGQRT